MKRSKIRPESAKHRAYREELARNSVLVAARSHGICEVCGERPATVMHHRLPRSAGGGNDLGNLLHVCQEPCHAYIHDHPQWAYERGLLLKRSGEGVRRYSI